ncbi:MAG: cation:proton antiporter [Acidobacteriia bacterium]|nr:cation:proton antiporter [Terriglobia bacterium]
MAGEHVASGNLVLAILIVFGSAKFLAEIFERIGQPGIVGEILAGVLIGPSVLGWIAPNNVMSTLGEIGLVFLLFQVGLEVKTAQLLRVGGTAALAAIAGVILPFAVGWGTWAAWGNTPLESIFVGAAMTATSVGITAQVLAARGLLSRTSSQIILGAAVIDDILALLVLGFVSAIGRASVNVLELVLTPLFAVVFIVIVVRWGSWTAGALFERFERKLRIGEAPFVLTMLLLFGLAALSEEAGVAAITGAFLAGTASSEVLPSRVRKQTQGIAELFVPFFLVGIGLNFHPAAFANRSTLIVSIVLLAGAVLSKVIGCGLGALSRGRRVALRVGVGMIPRGEFCVVAAQIGLRLNVISVDTYAVVVFIAVATTMLAPPLMNVVFRETAPIEAQVAAD